MARIIAYHCRRLMGQPKDLNLHTMATKEPWVVAGVNFDREPEFSKCEVILVREKIYLIIGRSCLGAIDDREV